MPAIKPTMIPLTAPDEFTDLDDVWSYLDEFSKASNDMFEDIVKYTESVMANPWVDSRDYNTLEEANTAAYNEGKILVIAQGHTLTANTTLTAKVIVLPGGSFTKASTYTLTINGLFEAGLHQVFFGFSAGDVTFGTGVVEEISIAWFGAKVDGTTNDTTAIDIALYAANVSGSTLTAQPGTCLITPGGLTSQVKCSIYAPNTIFKAATNAGAALFSINYSESLGFALKTFNIKKLQGYNNTTLTGNGLYFVQSDYSRFIIREIRDFAVGVYLDGSTNNAHIACNDFEIGHILNCKALIQMNSGEDSDHETESNHFKINYMHSPTEKGIFIGGGAYTTAVDENTFEIMSLEINIADAHGLYFESSAQRNHVIIRGIFGGDSGAGKLIKTWGTNNIFQIPTVDYAKIDDSGTGEVFIPNWTRRPMNTCLFVDADGRTKADPGTSYTAFVASGGGSPIGGMNLGQYKEARLIVQGAGNEAGAGKGVEFLGPSSLCSVEWTGSSPATYTGDWTTIPADWKTSDVPSSQYLRVKGSSGTEDITLYYVLLQFR